MASPKRALAAFCIAAVTVLVLVGIFAPRSGSSDLPPGAVAALESAGHEGHVLPPALGKEPIQEGGPPTPIVEGGAPPDVIVIGNGTEVAPQGAPERDLSVKPGGCSLEYGEAAQCLPVRAPGDEDWDCDAVHGYFEDGVALAGDKDPYKLDTNGDGIACGPND